MYFGGIGPWLSPMGRQDSIISIGMPPPLCNLGRGLEHRNGGQRPFLWPSRNFGPKTGLNLSEDLFFGLHLILGRKTNLVLGRKIFIWSSLLSNFLNFLALPPFENPAYATGLSSLLERVPSYVPTPGHGCRPPASTHTRVAGDSKNASSLPSHPHLSVLIKFVEL